MVEFCNENELEFYFGFLFGKFSFCDFFVLIFFFHLRVQLIRDLCMVKSCPMRKYCVSLVKLIIFMAPINYFSNFFKKFEIFKHLMLFCNLMSECN